MVRVLPGGVAQELEEDGDKDAVEAGEEWEARDPALARVESVFARSAELRFPIKPEGLVLRQCVPIAERLW